MLSKIGGNNMDFLLEEGFKPDLIKQMRQRYDSSVLDLFVLEQENVCDVIHYFQRIGIQPIHELLLTRIEVFTKDLNDVKDAFLKHNIKQVVEEINQDISTIDYL